MLGLLYVVRPRWPHLPLGRSRQTDLDILALFSSKPPHCPSRERPYSACVTEADYLRRTRDGYDRTASAYAERFHNHLDNKPLDLAMISAFAGLVGGGGVLADIGCG